LFLIKNNHFYKSATVRMRIDKGMRNKQSTSKCY